MRQTDSLEIPEPLAGEVFAGYDAFLSDIKGRVQAARTRAAFAVNAELVLLYWTVGREISQRMREHGWGSKVVDRLAGDLRREFPDMKGFSLRNLRYMRSFAEAWPDGPILQAALAKLTWYHNIALLEKLPSPDVRLWYARHAAEYGWSRNVLVHQIESDLYARLGKAVTNFERTLPAPQSDLAQQVLKDPYNFEFLKLRKDAEDLNVVDDVLRHPDDAPSIGLILCKEKKALSVEYALRGSGTPIGVSEYQVSEYQITERLPDELRTSLPTVEQMEEEFADSEEAGAIPSDQTGKE